MRREALIAVSLCVVLLLSGCGTRLTAKGECAHRGHPEGSPGYAECRESIRQEIMSAASGPTPGHTISVLGYNPSNVVIEYTKWYKGEFEAAMQTAQNYCVQFKKNATVGNTVPAGTNPYDRVVTTFYCT